jgi:hypothetical protein
MHSIVKVQYLVSYPPILVDDWYSGHFLLSGGFRLVLSMTEIPPSQVFDKVGAAIEIWATKETLDDLYPLPKSPAIVSVPGCRLTYVRHPDIPAMTTL